MAKRTTNRKTPKRELASPRTATDFDADYFKEVFSRIRKDIAKILLPWLDGPLPDHSEDMSPFDYPDRETLFNLGDGVKLYRVKDELETQPKHISDRFYLGVTILYNTTMAECHAQPDGHLASLFASAFYIGSHGGLLNLSLPAITREQCREGGSKGKLSFEEKAEINVCYPKLLKAIGSKNGAAMELLDRINQKRKDPVSLDTIKYAAGIRKRKVGTTS